MSLIFSMKLPMDPIGIQWISIGCLWDSHDISMLFSMGFLWDF